MHRVVIISSYARSLVDFRGALIADLISKDIQVFALAPNFDMHTRQELINLGAQPVDIRMSRAGMNPFRDFLSLLDIYKKLRVLRPNVVLSYFIKPVIYGTLAAWLAKVPMRISMIEGLGYVFTYTSKEMALKGRLLKLIVCEMYRFSLRFASKVIFLNPDDRAEFIKLNLVQRDKSVCLGGIGIDLKKWKPVHTTAGEVNFLMVARLLREKGIFEYVEAAKLVKLKHPSTQFVLLGGLDENPGSIRQDQVSAWHEAGVIFWHGHVPVIDYMKSASVFVLPSYREGVPVSTMEALATGRPIITTDVPGCRETVEQGVNGFKVPAKDPQALAEKMIWFIENPTQIVTMGEASRKLAEEKFDIKVINARLIEILLV